MGLKTPGRSRQTSQSAFLAYMFPGRDIEFQEVVGRERNEMRAISGVEYRLEVLLNTEVGPESSRVNVAIVSAMPRRVGHV